jgi:L-lactate dehydrogenase complex protein LldE
LETNQSVDAQNHRGQRPENPRVGLFVTCLVNLFRPSVGFAAAHLIEASGCTVVVPAGQTCCGQPAYNSGDPDTARDLALQTVRAFAGVDFVVAPSGSCAAMLRIHYPALFEGRDEKQEVQHFAARVHELTSFLVNVRGVTATDAHFAGRVVHHDACSGLRELGIRNEPRKLLAAVDGLHLIEAAEVTACCGFGGLFSVKYPAISTAIADRKIDDLRANDPDLVTSGDLGCLMNLAGRLHRAGTLLPCRHVAEVLSGEMHDPPIAGPSA